MIKKHQTFSIFVEDLTKIRYLLLFEKKCFIRQQITFDSIIFLSSLDTKPSEYSGPSQTSTTEILAKKVKTFLQKAPS